MTLCPPDLYSTKAEILLVKKHGNGGDIKKYYHSGQLKHAYKVVIAGNHECTFDDTFLRSSNREVEAKEIALKQALQASLSSSKVTSPKSLLTNGIYLEDSVIELFGIIIYGTPWQPRVDNWAFNLSRGQALLDKWNNIPAGVDVLLTHSPPLGE
ncbi:unnamed protein product [Strongylus vulgaris]|uniref:Calcineurin-like phosphoesterase domain-containing protein n=1 Tax=Strongylus vulgaris TaxID=40348 RepID=A0A3P7IQZ8_STRVU|nr:unnamed protein product [Strongylus vulgaris]